MHVSLCMFLLCVWLFHVVFEESHHLTMALVMLYFVVHPPAIMPSSAARILETLNTTIDKVCQVSTLRL